LKSLSTLLYTLAFGATIVLAAPPPQPLPRDSVYQATVRLTDDRSRQFAWSAKRGQPELVSMFYTSCKFVCPLIIDSAKTIQSSLTIDERARLGVTMISLDPGRDTPQALARVRVQHDLDPARWTLASPAPQDVRGIAALLGVRYRALADGDFNHSSVLVLLDADGRIVARTERIGGSPDPAFLAAVRQTLRSSAVPVSD
jgi:protein SCO1/2